MTIRLSVAARNAMLDGTLAAAFDSGTLSIYTGSQPASADSAASGTLLSTSTLPANAFASASSGSVAQNGTWSDTVDTTGTPGWFRLADSGDTVRIDGAISGDMSISGLVGGQLIAGGTFTVDTFTMTQPAS